MSVRLARVGEPHQGHVRQQLQLQTQPVLLGSARPARRRRGRGVHWTGTGRCPARLGRRERPSSGLRGRSGRPARCRHGHAPPFPREPAPPGRYRSLRACAGPGRGRPRGPGGADGRGKPAARRRCDRPPATPSRHRRRRRRRGRPGPRGLHAGTRHSPRHRHLPARTGHTRRRSWSHDPTRRQPRVPRTGGRCRYSIRRMGSPVTLTVQVVRSVMLPDTGESV